MKLHTLSLGMLGTNSYLVADETTGQSILIDAPDRADKILEVLTKEGYTLTEIVLTHGHYDHILALKDLKNATHVPIAIHKNGLASLKSGENNLCVLAGYDWEPITPDRLLDEGDRITAGTLSFQVLHTPGHTQDSICLYREGILFSGDTLFAGSIGRYDLPTGNGRQELKSIQEKLMTLPDDTEVYPGHGPKTTIGKERRENPYL